MIQISDKMKLRGLIQKGITHYYLFHEGMSKNLNDSDILLFFYEQSCACFSSTSSLNSKRLGNIIQSICVILSYTIGNCLHLDKDVVEKVRSLNVLYLDYIAKNNLPEEEYLVKQTDGVAKLVIDYYLECEKSLGESSSEEEESLSDAKDSVTILSLKEEISTLEEKIVSLEKELKESNKSSACLEKKLKVKKVKVTELNTLLKEYRQIIKDYEKMKAKWDRQIKEGEKANIALNGEVKDLKEKISSLESSLEYFQLLLKEMEEKNEEYESEKRHLLSLEETKNTLYSLILQELIAYPEGIDFQSLSKNLNKKCFLYSKEMIYERLMILNQTYNLVDYDNAMYPPLYKLTSPKICTNKDFYISKGNSSFMDLIFVSDYHLSSFDDDVMFCLDQLYDYCTKHNVHLIIHGGDVFSDKNKFLQGREIQISYIMQQLALFCEKHPFDHGITQAIMGGNHDEQYCKLGIDLVSQICRERHDFIDLGYNHAYLHFGQEKECIALHHPYIRCGEFLKKDNYDTTVVQSLMHNYYSDKSDSSIYFSLFAHFHKSCFDFSNALAFLPSLFRDRVQNGALHVRIYFDKENRIQNIVFFPLIMKDKLVAINEINYQKFVLKK